MRRIYCSALILLSTTSLAHGMNRGNGVVPCADYLSIQVYDNAQERVSTSLPKWVWEKIIAVSSCKNALRLVNHYLHVLASWSQREVLVQQIPFSLSRQDTEKMAFEAVEKDDITGTRRLLKFLKKRFKRKLIRLSPCNVSIWSRAKSNPMRQVLRAHASQVNEEIKHDSMVAKAACAGNVRQLTKEIENISDIVGTHGEQSHEAKEAFQGMVYAFMFAAEYGHSECVKELQPYMSPTARKHALWIANMRGDVACVEALLEKDLIDATNDHGVTLLRCAAEYGRTYLVKLWLSHGVDQLLKDGHGLCALDYAYRNQHAEIIQLLKQDLEAKNRVDVFEMVQCAVQLHVACKEGNMAVVSAALAQNKQVAAVPLPYKKTLLHVAAKYGHTDIIELLIAAGVPIDCGDMSDQTPLMYAIKNGQLEVVKLLHAKGANIRHTDSHGFTPLVKAVYENQLLIAQYLAQSGITVCDEMYRGSSLLHMAVDSKKNSAAMIRWLLTQGISLNQLDKGAKVPMTAFALACKLGRVDAATELIELGADTGLVDQDGIPSLHTACFKGAGSIVKILIDRGTDINQQIESVSFKTPMHSALYGGRKKIVKMLCDAGAHITHDMIQLAQNLKHVKIEEFLHKKLQMRASMPPHVWLPNEVWEKIIAMSSCKNVARLINRYLYGLASWVNRASLCNHVPLYLSRENALTLVVEQIENADERGTEVLLRYIQEVLAENPVKLVFCFGKNLWSYAQTDTMRQLLNVYGKRPRGLIHAPALVEAAHSGDVQKIRVLLAPMKDILADTQESEQKENAQKIVKMAACWAAYRGHYECLRELVAFVAQKDRSAVLQSAVSCCKVSCVELLLAEKCPVNDIDNVEEYSPVLTIAARSGNAYLVQLLLEHGADPSIKDYSGVRALDYALRNNHAEVIALLEQYMNKTPSYQKIITSSRLLNAVRQEDVEAIKTAYQQDPKLLTHDYEGEAPLLHVASAMGNIEIMKFLMQAGASIEQETHGHTPLGLAITEGRLFAVKLLHEAGADLNHENVVSEEKMTPLCMAVLKKGNLPIVQYLVERGVDVQQLRKSGSNLLHMAVTVEGAQDIIAYLVAQGVPVSAQAVGVHNATPLTLACARGQLEVVKQLIACGADKQIEADMPISTACVYGDVEIVRVLIEWGAQFDIQFVNLVNPTIKGPIYYAIQKGHSDIVELLIDKGVHITDDLIQFAHTQEQYEIEQFLRAKKNGQ